MIAAVDVLEQSIDAEGLFRKSGAVNRLKELRVHYISKIILLFGWLFYSLLTDKKNLDR